MKQFEANTVKVNSIKPPRKGQWSIFPALCKSCGICIEKCPFKALEFGTELGVYSSPIPKVDKDKCTLCNICDTYCPDCAIKVETSE
jgi:2-oxoglutarate ferredoxin oxidoreductase subunit delta